ncbi:DUF4349 domain-containing protein [Candidatus Woesearchaeota archaeon]|nr:DUF4349 domain-containing protein [Candidatus Woesearchaeota archaeon]
MALKKQLLKLKDNWLLILLFLILLFAVSGSSFLLTPFTSTASKMLAGGFAADEAMEMGIASRSSYYPSPVYGNGDFAPEVEVRKIIKTSSLSTEVKRGEFKQNEDKLKNIVVSSDSFILNENVNLYGKGSKAYYRGSYHLKVDTDKYDSVVTQLKEIGEVTSFNENSNDVTGQYVSLEDQLKLEKDRLKRYQDILDDAERIEDKINLNNYIFNQERTIKYIEDRINNLDKRVEYTTISFSMSEKQSEYVNVAVVKFSALIKNLVGSFNLLLKAVFWLFPWLILFLAYRGIKTYLEHR